MRKLYLLRTEIPVERKRRSMVRKWAERRKQKPRQHCGAVVQWCKIERKRRPPQRKLCGADKGSAAAAARQSSPDASFTEGLWLVAERQQRPKH